MRDCPSCGKRLRKVSSAHVRRQLRAAANRAIRGAGHGFCATVRCPVAFAAEDGVVQGVDSLRLPPAYKTGVLADLLCYCFDVTAKLAVGAEADDVERFIRERVAANDCACDILNPSTQCCLGSIGAFRKAYATPKRP